MNLNYLAPGVRVTFTYDHHLNTHSVVKRIKHGTVVRTVRHRNKFYAQQVAVIFDGNKQESIVHIDRIKFEPTNN